MTPRNYCDKYKETVMQLSYSINPRCVGKGEHHLSASGWQQKTTSVEELLQQTAGEGFGFMPALLTASGKSNDHIKQFCTICIDVDNSGSEITTWEEAVSNPFLQANALCIWESASSGIVSEKNPKGLDRFRVLFKLSDDFKVAPAGNRSHLREIDQLIKRLNAMIPGSDPAIKAGHYFAGRVGARFHVFGENTLDLDQVPVIVEPVRADRSQRADGPEDPLDVRIAKAVECLKRLPTRVTGAGTYGICFPALCSLVHEFGIDDAMSVIDLAEWHGDWDVLAKMQDIESSASDVTLRLGSLIELTREQLSGDDLEAFNVTINGLSKSPEPTAAEVVAMFPSIDGGFVAGKTVGGSAPDQMPTRAEIAALHVQLKDEPIARQMRVMLDSLLGQTRKIRFNELTQEIEVLGKGLKAYDFDTAEHWMDEAFGLMGAKTQAQNALKKVANRNRYHPVKEYLEFVGKTAPDVDLDLVAERVLGVTDQLSKAQIKAWLCGAVAKVWSEHGAPFIEVLTLISPRQGIGKSEFFKSLASPEWFGDSFAQTDQEKDRILCLHRKWINEISELDQFASKKDLKQLKGLVSTTTDTIRVPYGAVMEDRPRQFVIGATSNTQGLFAIDDEQRRFWAIEVHPTTDCGRLDIQWLRENRDAIWGTAVRRFQEMGQDSFKLTKEQRMGVITRNAETFQQTSHLEDKITQHLEEYNIRAISISEVLENICGLSNPIQKQLNEAGAILRRLGYERKENQRKHGQLFRTLWVNEQRDVDYNPNVHFSRKLFNPDFH